MLHETRSNTTPHGCTPHANFGSTSVYLSRSPSVEPDRAGDKRRQADMRPYQVLVSAQRLQRGPTKRLLLHLLGKVPSLLHIQKNSHMYCLLVQQQVFQP